MVLAPCFEGDSLLHPPPQAKPKDFNTNAMQKTAIWIGLVFLFACSNPDEPLLIGTWKYDMEAMRSYLADEQPKQQTVNYMEGIMAPLKDARLRFEQGGDLSLVLGEETVAGRWRLRGGGKKLMLNLTGTNSTYRIEVLSDSLLLLRPVQQEEDVPVFPRALVPAD